MQCHLKIKSALTLTLAYVSKPIGLGMLKLKKPCGGRGRSCTAFSKIMSALTLTRTYVSRPIGLAMTDKK